MSNNLSMINLLFEDKIQSDEQAQTIAKGLKHSDYVAKLARIFKLEGRAGEKIVLGALKRTEQQALNSLKTKSRNFVKNSDPATLASLGNQLPESLKLASKELAIIRLHNATKAGEKALTKTKVKEIVEATAKDAKLAFKDAQISAQSSKAAAQGVEGGVKSVGQDAKTAATASEKGVSAIAAGGRKIWDKTFGRIFKGGKNSPKIKVTPETVNTTSRIWKFTKLGAKGIGITSLLALGFVGYVFYDMIQAALGVDDLPDLDDIDPNDVPDSVKDWKKCIVDALEGKNNATAGNDDEGVFIRVDMDEFAGKKTGGWIQFYSDYRVSTKNGDTGKWECNQTAIKELNEQAETVSTSDLSAREISRVIDELDDQLSGDFLDGDSTDMKDALRALKSVVGKTYKGVDAVKVIVSNYPKIKGKELADHVENLTNLDFEGIEDKKEFLGIIGKPSKDTEGTQSDKEGSGRTNTSHLTVIWDDNKSGGSGGSTKYKPCDDFPMSVGCISDKIKNIQRCLNPTANLKVDGYYGPITKKAMLDQNIFADNDKDDAKITKKLYDTMMDNCGKKSSGDSEVVPVKKSSKDDKERETVKPVTNIEKKPIVKLDTEAMLQKNGKEALENLKNMTVGGLTISEILTKYMRFKNGRFVIDVRADLSEDQLSIINKHMSHINYSYDRRKGRKTEYVWVADSRDARRVARNWARMNKIDDNNSFVDFSNANT